VFWELIEAIDELRSILARKAMRSHW